MLRTVKIADTEYQAIKALAQRRGRFLQFVLNEAIRQYLATEKAKERAA